ncbi:MAG: hypothetical protein QXD15_00355 [Thermoplasmata archaeon]
MHVNVTTKKYKDKIYYAVRVFETTYQNGRKITKIVKTIGNTTEKSELEKLVKEGWEYIYEVQKDVPISIREITQIKIGKPIGLIRAIDKIFSDYGIKPWLKKIFFNNYTEFLEELAYRFYAICSERMLFLATEKPKDRYYRLLDTLYENKGKIEDGIYTALVENGKITENKVKIDITSTYFEGNNVSMALYGYSRDHRSDRKHVVILLVLVDEYPVYSYVFEGNKRDVSVFLDVVGS